MPLLAYALAKGLNLPPEIAIGVILVGSCPGGTIFQRHDIPSEREYRPFCRSNICFTLLAPILTPAIIYVLASEWLEVSASDMFMSVVKIVLVPIILGLIVQFFLKEQAKKSADIMPLVSVIAIVMIVMAVVWRQQRENYRIRFTHFRSGHPS